MPQFFLGVARKKLCLLKSGSQQRTSSSHIRAKCHLVAHPVGKAGAGKPHAFLDGFQKARVLEYLSHHSSFSHPRRRRGPGFWGNLDCYRCLRHTGVVSSLSGKRSMNLFHSKETHFFGPSLVSLLLFSYVTSLRITWAGGRNRWETEPPNRVPHLRLPASRAPGSSLAADQADELLRIWGNPVLSAYPPCTGGYGH